MSDKMITVATFGETTDAYLMKGALEESGIPCFLADENIIAANPLLSPAIGGIKLRVREEDSVLAKQIIAEIRGGEHALEQEPGDELHYCPRCNSQDIKSAESTNWAALLFSLLFMVPFGIVKKRFSCVQCGKVWKE